MRCYLLIVPALFGGLAPVTRGDQLANDVKAIFEENCYGCHGENDKADKFVVLDHTGLTEDREQRTYVKKGNPLQS